MDLNYRGLRTFWTVARLGTLRRAAAELGISEPAVSVQLRRLQDELGLALLERRGRRLALTRAGRLAFDYAEQIFRLATELAVQLDRGAHGIKHNLTVGLTHGVPKMLAQQLLAPVVADPTIGLVVLHGAPTNLIGDLASHAVDVIIANGALPIDPGVAARSQPLGTSGVTLFAGGELGERLCAEGGFPDALAEAPWLLPAAGTPLRRGLDAWLERHRLRPRIAAEFDDSGLLLAFGAVGDGVFATTSVVEEIVVDRYAVRVLGRTEDVRDAFYAVTMEPATHHPGILQMEEVAKTLFGPHGSRR